MSALHLLADGGFNAWNGHSATWGRSVQRQRTKMGAIVVSYSLILIMTHRTPQLRLATTAIAAVLALSSTQLVAQAAPAATQSVAATPVAATPDSAPIVTISSEPLSSSTVDPIAPMPTINEAKSTKSTTTHRAASVARPARAAVQVARAAVAAPVATPIAAPVETAPAPVSVADAPAAPPRSIAAATAAEDAPIVSSMLPIAGGVGLALLALIVAGLAMHRRRRRDEEIAAAEAYEPAVDEAPAQADPVLAEPAFTPPIVEPSPSLAPAPAIAMAAPVAAETATTGPCADAAPGSHVEAACEGPTEDNPSLSIKKRLKRAQFFDQREQLAAAGMAVPVATDAGLPDAVETSARMTAAVSE